jgi:hypothetical protein
MAKAHAALNGSEAAFLRREPTCTVRVQQGSAIAGTIVFSRLAMAVATGSLSVPDSVLASVVAGLAGGIAGAMYYWSGPLRRRGVAGPILTSALSLFVFSLAAALLLAMASLLFDAS